MANLFAPLGKITEHFSSLSLSKSPFLQNTTRLLNYLANPFCLQLSYFIILSLFGHLFLKISEQKTSSSKPHEIDIFFTSVSSTTVSSLSTVEMEDFSNTQLVIITVLMLFGGEVFVSLLEFGIRNSNVFKNKNRAGDVELGSVSSPRKQSEKSHSISQENENLKRKSIKALFYIILVYFLVIHILGSALISIYVTYVSSAREILQTKGLKIPTFSIFTVSSTFANCGFVPTNENMVIFKKNKGLLLLLIPQLLLGNTLFPSCLRLTVSVLSRISRCAQFEYILKNYGEFGYQYLFSGLESGWLAGTVSGLLLVQFVVFVGMEWGSEIMAGMSVPEKVVGSLFEVVNSRHAGESVFDLSLISPAILVMFVVIMYLPPNTSFSPIKNHEMVEDRRPRKSILEDILVSPLSFISIFVILICIIEREKLQKDPLNFNVLNIVFEVTSAYGNVGFSTGYSCKRQIKPDGHCKEAWYGFAGRWSTKGKVVLIVVMFFGRLKKFSMGGGRAWRLA